MLVVHCDMTETPEMSTKNVEFNAFNGENNVSSEHDYNDTKHQHVVKKSVEPGVINDAMLKNVLHAYWPSGEAARLRLNIAIDYGTITELCLEYQNILKINHIWMCFNLQKLSFKSNKLTKIENLDNLKELRELDLSFNFIKTIENLECLRQLEYVTLFQNDIRRIENLDQLELLVRLNLGNNFIETVDGIQSLRYKEQLFSLNLEGNPICDNLPDNIDFRLYIAAYLPKLKYYGYRVITNVERDKGRQIYKNKLRMLEETELERPMRKHEQSLGIERQRISCMSFVENLDKHQLFDSLFINNSDNNVCDTDTIINDTNKSSQIELYHNQVIASTLEMYEKSDKTFDRIRSACEAYFQSNIGPTDAVEQRHINIINHRLDLMCCRANKWLSETIEGYELVEYNRNRVKIMEISGFIDAERSAFSQLKDNLTVKFEMQAHFQIETSQH